MYISRAFGKFAFRRLFAHKVCFLLYNSVQNGEACKKLPKKQKNFQKAVDKCVWEWYDSKAVCERAIAQANG